MFGGKEGCRGDAGVVVVVVVVREEGVEAVVTAPGLKCRDLNENQLVVRHYLSVLVPEKHGHRERKNSPPLPLALPLLNPARPGLPPYLSPSLSLSPPPLLQCCPFHYSKMWGEKTAVTLEMQFSEEKNLFPLDA